jgi:hypothetical protein
MRIEGPASKISGNIKVMGLIGIEEKRKPVPNSNEPKDQGCEKNEGKLVLGGGCP